MKILRRRRRSALRRSATAVSIEFARAVDFAVKMEAAEVAVVAVGDELGRAIATVSNEFVTKGGGFDILALSKLVEDSNRERMEGKRK